MNARASDKDFCYDVIMVGQTPEFVRWAIARPCLLREFEAWDEPAEVERRLRPLHSYCDAVAEGRLFEGICVASSVSPESETWGTAKGFRASEVLAAYGGEKYIQELCADCPANARRAGEGPALAGCFGHLEFSGLDGLHENLETVVKELGIAEDLSAEFLITTPRWYGLWAESLPRRDQLELLARLFAGLAAKSEDYRQRLADFLAAVAACDGADLPLHLALVPRGEYTATRWTIVSHCPRCKAAWPSGPRRCAACGLVGHPQPSQRRNVRGERPYWRLAGFLGPANVGPFLTRYFAQKL